MAVIGVLSGKTRDSWEALITPLPDEPAPSKLELRRDFKIRFHVTGKRREIIAPAGTEVSIFTGMSMPQGYTGARRQGTFFIGKHGLQVTIFADNRVEVVDRTNYRRPMPLLAAGYSKETRRRHA